MNAQQALLDRRVNELRKYWDEEKSPRLSDKAMLKLYWILQSVNNGLPMPAIAFSAIAQLKKDNVLSRFEQDYCPIPVF